jgi:hypothetical protein
VCRHPALTATAPAIPTTCTGTADVVVVPSPSCPKSLSPQHRIVPLLNTAHVWAPPPLTAVTPVMPLTGREVDDWMKVPSPSCPWPFRPQQRSVPFASSAQV